MAKYQITYKCGHKKVIELFGKEDERKRKIAWIEQNCVCSDCKKVELEKNTSYVKLAELEGSEKQIAWAEKIRLEKINASKESFEKASKDLATAKENFTKFTVEQIEKFGNKVQEFFKEKEQIINNYNHLLTETSAKWFIENRF